MSVMFAIVRAFRRNSLGLRSALAVWSTRSSPLTRDDGARRAPDWTGRRPWTVVVGSVLHQSQVRSTAVVVGDEFPQQGTGVLCIEDDDVVEKPDPVHGLPSNMDYFLAQ